MTLNKYHKVNLLHFYLYSVPSVTKEKGLNNLIPEDFILKVFSTLGYNKHVIQELEKQGYIEFYENTMYQFTQKGIDTAKEILKAIEEIKIQG